MRNRAKCKKCLCIIESLSENDSVSCECGEIIVAGGERMLCAADDWVNFVRVDDEGNEIIPQIVDTEEKKRGKQSKKELINMLDEMIHSYDRLPASAMSSPVTNYDLGSALLLISELFRSDDSDCR